MSAGSRAPSVKRRGFVQAAAVAAGGVMVVRGAAEPAHLVDTNVHLSRWPLRRLSGDDTSALVAKLRSHGVTEAWAGSFDGLLHRDIDAVNARLAQECQGSGGLLKPFGSVNPMLPDWEEDLRRCAEHHRMPGIRLHPAYHGYRLDDPAFARLLRLAAARGLVVQVVIAMEDRRMMHPLLQAESPELPPLAAVVKGVPGLRLELLGLKAPPPAELLQAGSVCFEHSMVDGVGGLARLFAQGPAERILFGSHAPLFYFESAILKLRESILTDEQLKAVRWANAARLLKGTVM